jgi:hypothetical protein
MSVGGVFTLINNDEIQDKLIMATDELMLRIQKIGKKRLEKLKAKPAYAGLSDSEIVKKDKSWMPTLAQIEKKHIVFVHSTYKPFVSIAHEYSKTMPRGGQAKLGQSFNFTMPVYGEFVNDAVVYIKLENFSAKSTLDKVRYVEMLGHRICKTTKFKLNQCELDSYTADRHNINWQFKVPQNKELGYLRNIGQEVPKLGYLTADPTVDEVREYRYFGDGPQTFKTIQPTLELWIPLLFWFKDINTSLPNFLFPYGQTDIEIELEKEENLVAYANYSGSGGTIYNPPVITSCALYMNHIFLLPEISRIFATRFSFQLIRITRTHRIANLHKSEDSVLLQQLKWPIECMYVAFRPSDNLTNSQRWHRNTVISTKNVKEAVVTGVATIQVNNAVYYNEEHVISSLGLRAYDIPIYPDLPPAFYNSYIPFRYGTQLKTPRDLGWYMLNFNVNPGEYQPSGHFNASPGRELYLQYVSAINPDSHVPYISSENSVELIVVADCINFLLVKNKSAVLRFST